VDAQHLDPAAHVIMQAAVQKYVDSAVSKTINVPADMPFEAFKTVYREAYELGCKGCTTYRPNVVTGAVLSLGDGAPAAAGPEPAAGEPELPLEAPAARPRDVYEAGGVVYMTRPLDRPEVLPGRTYKLKWPVSDHAIYITVNDVVQDGRRRPFEIFINSKNMEHYAWTVALTRMISAVFRRGGDVSFVVEELKAVFDPQGGAWIGGRYVPSLLAAIGDVIRTHMIDIGFLPAPEEERHAQPRIAARAGADGSGAPGGLALARQCPKCGCAGLIHQEGCDLCTACGYSKCA
jgi:ribonucleoside-diphosphate reductase alpha chain